MLTWPCHAPDFVPARAAQALEPALDVLGYGHYTIRPSVFCGLVTCLVNTSTLTAFPVARLFDLPRLHRELQPWLQRIARDGGRIGFNVAQGLRSALVQCAVAADVARSLAANASGSVAAVAGTTPGMAAGAAAAAHSEPTDVAPDLAVAEASGYTGFELPDAVDLLLDRSADVTVQATIRNLQFICVHNNMDFAAIDYARRCQCAALTATPAAAAGFTAMCTGCI